MNPVPDVQMKEQGTPEAKPSGVASPSLKDQIWKVLGAEKHRAYSVENLLPILKLQSPKDPQKQAQAAEQVAAGLRQLIEDGLISEIADGLFKARIFFDPEQSIEHTFIGGMGNILYRFRSPIFRMNIGVLSLYFIRDKKAGDWMITVKDTTIGRDYGLARRLRDGVYRFGSHSPKEGDTNYLQIAGRYITKEHLTLTISGDEIRVEDHATPSGTRIDFLTKEGLARYQQAARTFLQNTDPRDHRDIVKRGRFALEQLLQHHQNFETTFFSAVVDSLLFEGLNKASKT